MYHFYSVCVHTDTQGYTDACIHLRIQTLLLYLMYTSIRVWIDYIRQQIYSSTNIHPNKNNKIPNSLLPYPKFVMVLKHDRIYYTLTNNRPILSICHQNKQQQNRMKIIQEKIYISPRLPSLSLALLRHDNPAVHPALLYVTQPPDGISTFTTNHITINSVPLQYHICIITAAT